MSKIPAGKALPVLPDEQGLTLSRALRDFPELRTRPRMVQETVERFLRPVGQREGDRLILVYDAGELRTLLAEILATPKSTGGPNPPPGRKLPVPLSMTAMLADVVDVDRQIIVAGMDALRERGLSWVQIAPRMGYSSADVAQQAYKRARERVRELLDADEVLEWAEGSLLTIYEKFDKAVQHPGYMHDIRGALLLDPDGNPTENEDARQKALLGQVKVIEVETRLRGVVAPTKREVTHDIGPLEKRLLEAYKTLEQRAIESAHQTIQGEVLGDGEEGSGEGDEAGGLNPVGAGSERPEKEQQDGGDQEDQPQSGTSSPGHSL